MNILIDHIYDTTWDNIKRLRGEINRQSDSFPSEHFDHIITMACVELMENACKYSTRGAVHVVLRQVVPDRYELIVSNITNMDQLSIFEDVFEDVGTGSPDEAYQKRALLTIDDEEDSRLGLARIRYELGATLEYITAKNTVLLRDENNHLNEEERQLTVTVHIPLRIKENHQ